VQTEPFDRDRALTLTVSAAGRAAVSLTKTVRFISPPVAGLSVQCSATGCVLTAADTNRLRSYAFLRPSGVYDPPSPSRSLTLTLPDGQQTVGVRVANALGQTATTTMTVRVTAPPVGPPLAATPQLRVVCTAHRCTAMLTQMPPGTTSVRWTIGRAIVTAPPTAPVTILLPATTAPSTTHLVRATVFDARNQQLGEVSRSLVVAQNGSGQT
jgi:hypothetical protein